MDPADPDPKQNFLVRDTKLNTGTDGPFWSVSLSCQYCRSKSLTFLDTVEEVPSLL
jgi:hypothetical protein